MREWVIQLENDWEIIAEFEKGDIERASYEFVRKYKNFVYLVVYRYVRNHEDAEDVSQEVFISALRKIRDFRQQSSLKTWLYRIAVNKSKNFLNKKSLISIFSLSNRNEEKDDVLDFPDTSQWNNLENKELEDKFLEILSSLPEKQREVFALRYFDNISFKEISSLLGTSVGGLKANYFHAVKKIAKELKKYLEE
ncbi:MAG: sigma-70 family RNA polymerase sigma factor [Ignavibacteria bacterium]|nr:sigma-70 family RNA polymerase sigma factor [Ignavibacteria bacterium]